MPSGFNRVQQVRIADRLRSTMSRDEAFGLPMVETLSAADQRELCEASGGRLAVVAIRLDGVALAAREVVRVIAAQLRRTDVLCCSRSAEPTLLVLAPGLDPAAGRPLVARLVTLLAESRFGASSVGTAYGSAASRAAWTIADLVSEAREAAFSASLAA